MLETDLSRVGELFYQKVGSKENKVCLEGFIRHAFLTYSQRYLVQGVEGVSKRISYPSEDGRSRLTLVVVPNHGLPDLSRLEISGKISELSSLFELLRGNLNAEFKGLKLEDVVKPVRKVIVKSRKDSFARLGDLGIYFSEDPQDPNTIKRVVSQRAMRKSHVEEANFDDDSMYLLSAADHIRIKDSFYVDDDRNNDLIHESCNIVQSTGGMFHWDYLVCVANKQSLPASLFQDFDRLFNLVKDSYGMLSFQRIKIRNTLDAVVEDERYD
jgi:hypothetical protein